MTEAEKKLREDIRTELIAKDKEEELREEIRSEIDADKNEVEVLKAQMDVALKSLMQFGKEPEKISKIGIFLFLLFSGLTLYWTGEIVITLEVWVPLLILISTYQIIIHTVYHKRKAKYLAQIEALTAQ